VISSESIQYAPDKPICNTVHTIRAYIFGDGHSLQEGTRNELLKPVVAIPNENLKEFELLSKRPIALSSIMFRLDAYFGSKVRFLFSSEAVSFDDPSLLLGLLPLLQLLG